MFIVAVCAEGGKQAFSRGSFHHFHGTIGVCRAGVHSEPPAYLQSAPPPPLPDLDGAQ